MKKIIWFIFAFLILTGCDQGYDIDFPSIIEFEKQDLDICQYISSIDGTEVRDFTRSANKIEEGEYHVSCPTLKIKELGKQEVTISINSIDTVLNFEVVDTTPPEIKVENDELEVEENNEYFDLKKLVVVNDLYDHNPIIGFNGAYDLSTPGNYEVIVTAKDSSDNQAIKNIHVNVTEKEVEIIEKQIIVNGNNAGESSISKNGSQSVIDSPSSVLTSKTWLFESGYDLQSGFTACQAYRGSNAGSCKPLLNENGLAYGYIYNP